MQTLTDSSSAAATASLVVVDPNGHRSRVPIEPLPFRIGRHPENQLIIRDNRASRSHAQIVLEKGRYWLEDCGSRHGTFLNGQRVTRAELRPSDTIEFGARDSYQAIFTVDGGEWKRLAEQMTAPHKTGPGSLSKLRGIMDLARTVQSGFSTDDVLVSVVDAALAATGAERGFLLLRSPWQGGMPPPADRPASGTEEHGHAVWPESESGLETRVARYRGGQRLDAGELRVPREVIRRALDHRRELLSMNFEPAGAADTRPQNSIADLELRSVICVPLVRMRAGQGDSTSMVSTANETIGVLYMDSRAGAADLANGNRELLQSLAIEASTVLENARLLEEERAKQKMDEELRLARTIQQSLLPGRLPDAGWLRAAGSSVASHEVGGDYFDVAQVSPHCWSAVVADVSGKGVGSALLASLLQGALLIVGDRPSALGRRLERINWYLLDRTGGEKYATIFYCLLDAEGRLSYVNAGHCAPLLVKADGEMRRLEATATPVGLIEGASFAVSTEAMVPGDKIVIYTDGVTEAQNAAGEFFGRTRLRDAVASRASADSSAVHAAIHEAVNGFTEGSPQADDITVLVLEYAGAPAAVRN